MAKQKTSRTRKKTRTANDYGVYINLLTDFGFKRVFGIKEVMLKFLNAVLDIEGGIVDLRYDNPEKLGFSKDDRKAIFDLYCITGKEEHIIVEIQSAPQVYFKDRTLVYIARLINSLSEKGKDWNYELPRMYSINILDFSFEEVTPPVTLPEGKQTKKTNANKFVSKVQLIDCDTDAVFFDKLTFFYIELKKFTKEFHEAKTFLEQWIYIIKNLHELNDMPEKLRKDEIFVRLFEIAKIARMTTKEVNNYLKDLENMNMIKNELKTLQNYVSDRDNIIIAEREAHQRTRTEMGNTIAQKDNALQNANAELAEYKRRFGVLTT